MDQSLKLYQEQKSKALTWPMLDQLLSAKQKQSDPNENPNENSEFISATSSKKERNETLEKAKDKIKNEIGNFEVNFAQDFKTEIFMALGVNSLIEGLLDVMARNNFIQDTDFVNNMCKLLMDAYILDQKVKF